MLAPSTPNRETSLHSRCLKGKGIPGAQKAQKAREEGGRKPSPPFCLERGLAPEFPTLPFPTPATQAAA